LIAGAVMAVLVVVVTAAVVVALTRSVPPVASGPPCTATVDGQTFTLELDQAGNATTIAAVGKREGMADHAVTIALATAMQESHLRNLGYGDRDSLGLFQQRPSQGWGTKAEIMDPSHAARAFYAKLVDVSGWQTLDVTDAAQQVQHSGLPTAYAQWEAEARVLAQALTGEVPGAFTCRVVPPKGVSVDPDLDAAMVAELGPAATVAAPTPAQAWTTATWLVGHADRYHLSSVTCGGQRWTAATGAWMPVADEEDAASEPGVQVS
jgi:hypothetical protein